MTRFACAAAMMYEIVRHAILEAQFCTGMPNQNEKKILTFHGFLKRTQSNYIIGIIDTG